MFQYILFYYLTWYIVKHILLNINLITVLWHKSLGNCVILSRNDILHQLLSIIQCDSNFCWIKFKHTSKHLKYDRLIKILLMTLMTLDHMSFCIFLLLFCISIRTQHIDNFTIVTDSNVKLRGASTIVYPFPLYNKL